MLGLLTVIYNPIIINVSTRGNGDIIVILQILLALKYYLEKRYTLSA